MEKLLLAKCGLNQTEQSVLLFLLQNGKSSAGLISKRTNIKRPTVYSALASLERMGLIGKNSEASSMLFAAIEPDVIPGIFINRAKQNLQSITQASLQLETCFKNFKKARKENIAGYDISTFESEDAVFSLLEKVLSKGNYRGFFNPQTAFVGKGREVAEMCLLETAKTRPPVREIAVKGPLSKWWISKIRNPNHVVKEIRGSQSLVTDLLLFDGVILLTNYSPSGTMAIMIKHPDYYELMGLMFETLWNAL